MEVKKKVERLKFNQEKIKVLLGRNKSFVKEKKKILARKREV